MLLLLLFLLLITPVELCALWDHGLTLTLRFWGIGRSFPVDLSPSAGQSPSRQQLMRLIGTALRTDKARLFLLRHVTLVCIQALLRLGLRDAARTAVCAGLLQQLAQLLPERADIRIQPDFLSPTRLQLRCILFFHLGTLIITAGMALVAYLLEAREHPKPHPKEA